MWENLVGFKSNFLIILNVCECIKMKILQSFHGITKYEYQLNITVCNIIVIMFKYLCKNGQEHKSQYKSYWKQYLQFIVMI